MQMPENLNSIPWLAAGYCELCIGVGRYGSVGATGQYVPVYEIALAGLAPYRVIYVEAGDVNSLRGPCSLNSQFGFFQFSHAIPFMSESRRRSVDLPRRFALSPFAAIPQRLSDQLFSSLR
jgi:hypothetical protein